MSDLAKRNPRVYSGSINTRIALLSLIIASSSASASDHGYVPHSAAEWSAFYSFDDPNLTESQRRAAADFLHQSAAADTDGTESNHPSLVELVRRSKPAVVQLEVDASDGRHYTGTGFFISSDGYCVTAGHMVSKVLKGTPASPFAGGLVAIANDGTQYLAQRIAYLDEDADVAILKFDCRDVAFLLPGNIEAEEGESIIVIGSPECLSGTVSTGIVSSIRADVIQISAPISSGSSGSPVMNEEGRVIGVAVGSREDGQNLNFAVPLIEIWKGLGAVKGLSGRYQEILNQAE
jgi:S1-C subfamily serine protease